MNDDDDQLNVSARMVDLINMQNSFLAQSHIKMSSAVDGRSKSTFNQYLGGEIDIKGLKGTAISQRDNTAHMTGNFGSGRYGSVEENS